MKLAPEWRTAAAMARPEQAPLRDGWLAAGLVAAALLWLIACYGETVASMVAIWRRSDTFAHGFLIVPISAWLIWQRRGELAGLAVRPNFLVLPPLALAGFCWLLGRLAGVEVVQQYAVAGMIPLVVWLVLGNEVFRSLAFPLLFLLFAVPFGEFLVPPLMEHTATVTVAALRLTGVPVYREGLSFMLPSGSWSVVEACSGLRYLIASATIGCLYAYLTYRTLRRRAAFVVAAIIVPIFANWLRAYMIVMIGHVSDMQYAVGVDHLIYGWLFFGVVMLLLFWAGSYWREDLAPLRDSPASRPSAPDQRRPLAAIAAAAVAATVVAAVWPAAAERLEAAGTGPVPALEAPPGGGDWTEVSGSLADLRPHFVNPAARLDATYGRDARRAALHVAYYRNQRQGAELITSENALVAADDRAWARTAETRVSLPVPDGSLPLIETKLRGRHTRLLVWHWYWIDGRYVVDPYWAKLLHAKARLAGHGDDSAVIIAYTPYDVQPQAAESVLRDFVNSMLPGVTRALDHAHRGKPGS